MELQQHPVKKKAIWHVRGRIRAFSVAFFLRPNPNFPQGDGFLEWIRKITAFTEVTERKHTIFVVLKKGN